MIQIKNVVKEYVAGDMKVEALKGININFRDSEFVSILGPSGCGKTTLLNIIGGLDKYTSGDIVINNVSTKDYSDRDWDTYRNHYIGFVFQSYNLIAHLSILENVEIALSIAGMNKKEKREKAIEALEKVGLKDQIKKKPNQLSGGQMQRVAIARAIVNNPQVILADEPTGALDSETSVQVMDILKEISKTCLVVLVTHNGDLAEKYSDRIIKILDGNLVNDSNPYLVDELNDKNEASETILNKDEKIEIQEESNKQKNKKSSKSHSAMRFTTAFSLSFKNLISKKLKTILISFAGSIGIIGIALVLAVSNGFNRYINNMQSDTLSGYPVTIGTVAVNFDAFSTLGSEEDKVEVDKNTELELYDMSKMLEKFGTFNFLNQDFIKYIDDYYDADKKKSEAERELLDVKYTYSTAMSVLTKYSEDVVVSVNSGSSISALGSSSTTFFEGLNNKEYILNNYEILGGENAHYPTSANEIALVIDKDNSESIQTMMTSYGINISDANSESIKFEDLIGKEYKVISTNNYFQYDDVNDEFTQLELKTLSDFMTGKVSASQMTDMMNYYNYSDNITLKVSCVLRAKEDSITDVLSSGMMYLPELTNLIMENAKQSTIYEKTKALGLEDDFYIPYTLSVAELEMMGSKNSFSYTSPKDIINKLNAAPYNLTLTKDDAIELALQMVGASSIPSSVSLYANSFDAKQNIIDYIGEWNQKDLSANNKITYSDATAFLTDTLGNLIDIISYVLIAFAAISLVVSSIMIGIITYTSVIERTKEIGVLRSIGARKKDITRVFNSETLIIGFVSGFLGIFISWLLTFPISAIIRKVAGGAVTGSLAIITWQNAVALISISTILTLISGLIPARIAANKDPVKALRTE